MALSEVGIAVVGVVVWLLVILAGLFLALALLFLIVRTIRLAWGD